MPTWDGILKELNESKATNKGHPDFDGIRRKYLVATAHYTGRNLILYAAKFTQPSPVNIGQFVTIADQDLQAIMTVIHGLEGTNLDLMLHSPGGSLEAAEALVKYLRSKFRHIRVIVPHLAMSAATMISCAADVIVLGKHSFLGPIDPQIGVITQIGPRLVPAQSILDQFELAKDECQDPKKMGAWLPQLAQFGPDLLVECKHALKLSGTLVEEWLGKYMFKRRRDREKLAKKISEWLSDHTHWKSHGRHISRDELEKQGLRIEHLEKDQKAQDLFLSVFHTTTHTFSGTPAVKIIENHLGNAFVQLHQAAPVMINKPHGKPETEPTRAEPKK